ncbi:MAG: hypothetical protein IIB90_06525 [Gemmatimonadetes bacterium]|nr:hypothetical protein [Gemmatimonadota bacterium]
MTGVGLAVAFVGLESLGKGTGNVTSTAGHKYGDVLTISPLCGEYVTPNSGPQS